MRTDESAPWLALFMLFRLAFRFISVRDDLSIVLFYNVPLLMKLPGARFVIPGYILLMGALEVYFMTTLRKGLYPLKLLSAYFVMALVFEFPYVAVKSGDSGILLFTLVWYIPVPIGLLLVLFSYHSWKTP
jgi:hypothetical protein